MKKLALAALAAMPALAGTPADVPAVTLTPAPAASPWSADLATVYRYQLNDPTKLEDSGIHTMGADLTLNYAVTEADYVNIRFGYSYGNETWRNAMGSLESNRHTFYIMPGYKHEWTVSEKTKVYAGANIGMANLSDKTKMKMDRVYKDHDSDWALLTPPKWAAAMPSARIGPFSQPSKSLVQKLPPFLHSQKSPSTPACVSV